jgi:hypothetical protein
LLSTTTIQATSLQAGADYRQPDWFTKHVMNPAVKALTRAGVSVLGARVLEHKGRVSGEIHRTPVNLLTFEDKQYLVAPRGETQWVRNVQAAGGRLTLIKGRKRTDYEASRVDLDASVPLLRAYLARWKFEVGMFFDGVGPDSSDVELRAIAERHPVFELRQIS